jgi:hypothetical protein
MSFVVISVAIQLALAIHVLKTGRRPIWVIIIGFFPIIGCLAYLVVELLPAWLGSKSGRTVQKKIDHTLYPERDLQEALHNVQLADTVSNRMKLAEQYLLRQQYQEAQQIYEKSLTGFYKHDPALMLGSAKANFGLGNYNDVVSLLDNLKETNPDFKSAEGHLLYARAQENAGNIDAAIQEYETLITYYPTPEPTCRFAALLKTTGHTARAMELFHKVVKYSETAGRQYNYLNEEWVTWAKRETSI